MHTLTAGLSASSEPSHIEASAGSRRVLAVDDDPSVRLIRLLNLRLAGFDLTEAAADRRGLVQAQLEPPHLVLLADLRIPGLDGFALADALDRQERTCAVPIVFLSGETGVAERRRAYRLGAAGFVAKPFDPVALVTLLAGVIERTAVRQTPLSALPATGPATLNWHVSH